jgi:hypothetical protein
MLLKEGDTESREEEEDVSVCWMTLRKSKILESGNVGWHSL